MLLIAIRYQYMCYEYNFFGPSDNEHNNLITPTLNSMTMTNKNKK